MKSALTFLLSALITITGCKKEGFENAPFRCKINGETFMVSDDQLSISVIGGNNFYIRAIHTSNPLKNELYGEITLDFLVDTIKAVPLNNINTWRWNNNGSYQYDSDPTNPGVLDITFLDLNAKRITGTFALIAKAENSNNKKEVSEGSFDLTW